MSQPKVTIIVTAYLERSKPYLDLCIESIKNLAYPDIQTIIVSPPWYTPEYPGVITVHPSKPDYFNAHALNYGAQCADHTAEYFFMINDDVILGRSCLKNLVANSQGVGDCGIFMPVGNDAQGRHLFPVPYLPSGPYRVQDGYIFRLGAERVKYEPKALMDAESQFPYGMLFFETLCLYCVLIPRKVFEAVGEFDDSRAGHDDFDYCHRVAKRGLVNAICLNSLCYHAGGVSSSITFTQEMREHSQRTYEEKWR